MTADRILDGLLAAVIDEPDDDLRRLVYADRCEELDDLDRATFVRTQLDLEKHRNPANGLLACEKSGGIVSRPGQYDFGCFDKYCRCRVCTLKRREYHAGERHVHCDWTAFFHQKLAEDDVRRTLALGQPVRRNTLAPGVRTCDFRRGFVEAVSLSANDWVRHGDALAAQAPIRTVRLYDSCDEEEFGILHARVWPLPRGTNGFLQLDMFRLVWPKIDFEWVEEGT